MTRRPMPQLSIILAAALLAVPVLIHAPQPARADVRVRVGAKVRIHGKLHVRGTARARHRHRRVHRRPAPRPSHVRGHVEGGVYWGGGIYVGPRFAAPPPPPSCECEPYPAPEPYREPHREAAAVAAPAPDKPALPRWGIGVFAGAIDVDERMQGDDLGLLGRLRLTDSLLIEGEVARTEMGDGRTDQRLGGSLLYDLAPRSSLSLHLLGGGGVIQADLGGRQSQQRYGELGLGLTYRATKRLHLAADLRGGARERIDAASAGDAGKALAPSAEEAEPFTRGRLSAILYF